MRMSNIEDHASWVGVPEHTRETIWDAGADRQGPANAQARALANRTRWLREYAEATNQQLSDLLEAVNPFTQYLLATEYAPVFSDDDPTAGDDSYPVGKRWVNTSTHEWFVCSDNTASAAVWEKTTLTMDELGSMAVGDTGIGAGQYQTNAQNRAEFASRLAEIAVIDGDVTLPPLSGVTYAVTDDAIITLPEDPPFGWTAEFLPDDSGTDTDHEIALSAQGTNTVRGGTTVITGDCAVVWVGSWIVAGNAEAP